MTGSESWIVIGPLHGRLTVLPGDKHPRLRWPDGSKADPMRANARLILHRTAVAQVRTGRAGTQRMEDLDDRPIRTWAVETDLGHRRGDKLSAELAKRRARALQLLAADRNAQVLAVTIEPQSALIVGAGASGIRNVGIELHGTHGWPIIPASTLKGIASAYGQDTTAAKDSERIFGAPRPGSDPAQADGSEAASHLGSVLFFDALPGTGGVSVAEHVLTPHVRDYHMASAAEGIRPAPSDYLNPVPIPFLAIDGGTFTAHLLGPPDDVMTAAKLLADGMDDCGIGAKTSAGYGYATATWDLLPASTAEAAP